MNILKHSLKRFFIWRFYREHVAKNDVIKEDIRQTLIVRGSKVKNQSIEKQFRHAMLYYPEYAMVFFWRLKTKYLLGKTLFIRDFNCKIFKSTKIAKGMMCYHPFATVINAKSIGKNFQFRNGLTIGNKNNDNNLIPIIGDDVTVGANVVIIGNISIGDNVVIGAGAVVVKNVPSNCIIAGNPAKIIKHLTDG